MDWTLRNLLSWPFAKYVVNKDVGPFSSKTLSALLNNQCIRCGRLISDHALIKNALVVQKEQILVLCRECRGAGRKPSHVFQWYGKWPMAEIILLIAKHKCRTSKVYLDWFEILIILRADSGYLYPLGEKEPFVHIENRKLPYGQIPGIGNCGECGAFWTNNYGMKPEKSYSAAGVKTWSDSECYHCGLEHRHQWHMRISEVEERELLFGRHG